MDLYFTIDPKSGIPIYIQLVEQIKDKIAHQELSDGDQLSTVRQMAATLEINPNTVSRAYAQLEREGFLLTRQGRGTFITSTSEALSQEERSRRLSDLCRRFLMDAGRLGYTSEEALAALRGEEIHPAPSS